MNTYRKSAYRSLSIEQKKNNVGFILTEISGPVESLSEAENMEYEHDWFTVVKNNRIPWMWNYPANVFAPQGRLYPYNSVHDTVRYERTPLYEYPSFVNFIKKYR